MIIMSDDSPTLAHALALSKKIDLNMVEERVMTSRFSKDTTTTSRGQQSTSQLHSGGGGSYGGQGRPKSGSGGTCTQRLLPSFVGTILLDMWWCSYLEGLSTREWWMDFG